MAEETVHIVYLSIEFLIPMSGSLKEKRRVVKSLKDRLRNRYNVSVAEVGEMDKWQRSVIAVCAVNRDKTYLDQCVQNILSFVDQVHDIQLTEHQIEFL